jgi:hypothetical protein
MKRAALWFPRIALSLLSAGGAYNLLRLPTEIGFTIVSMSISLTLYSFRFCSWAA